MQTIKATLSLLIVLCCGMAVSGQDFEEDELPSGKLESEFLGIHLGCSLAELKTAIQKPKFPIKFMKKSEEDGVTTYLFTGNHRLKGATGTAFSFWQGKLTMCGVYFKGEDAESIYDALQKLATKKYGKTTDGIVFGGKKCQVIKGAMAIQIEYESGVLEAGTTIIAAAHIGLNAAMEEKRIEDKADDLGDL